MAPDGDEALFGQYRTEVEGMLAMGRPVGAVERMLERAPLSGDQRSALWLLAWALHDNVGASEPIELELARGDALDWPVHE